MLHLQPLDEIDYPTSDGEPMGETDLHRDLMIDLIEALKGHFDSRPDIYVSGNILMFYEEGNRYAHLSPDVLIALDVPQGSRESYKIWEEKKAPDLVVEVTSESTRMRDIGVKKGVYEAIGIHEYVLFDPRAEYLKPRFQVFQREGEFFVRNPVSETIGYTSTRTGLIFRVVNGALRVFDLLTGEILRTPREQTARADEEAARANALAAENRELRRRLEELQS